MIWVIIGQLLTNENADKHNSQNSKLQLIFFQDIITIAISLDSKRKQGTRQKIDDDGKDYVIACKNSVIVNG